LSLICAHRATNSANWETRHGSGIGLREILKKHGSGAGKTIGQTSIEQKKSSDRWKDDCGIKMICVLALDRFADYIGDQVVAPVRETISQALGALVAHTSSESTIKLFNLLLVLLNHNSVWELRHASLLALKVCKFCYHLLKLTISIVYPGC